MELEYKRSFRLKEIVFSLDFGEGKIVNLYKLYDGVEDYIEVFFEKINLLKQYPRSAMGQLRLKSDRPHMSAKLDELHFKINSNSFRREYFINQRIGVVSIDYLVNVVASLFGRKNLGILDKRILQQCLSSLILEVSKVFNINEMKAKKMVDCSLLFEN